MLLNTIEVTSKPRATVAECLADIASCIDFLSPIARRLRIDLAAAGTHPFARPGRQRVTNSRRYAQLVERTQYWGRQMLLYGVHVHVGVEDRDKVLPIQAALSTHLGHLQAIAASSPYWAGVDTGYASNRAMVFQQLPTAGIPRHFDTWEALESYTEDMIRTGVIKGFDEVRWDIRPSPAFGTVENRVFDAATNILEVGVFAALTHVLVEHFSRMYDAGEALPVLPDRHADLLEMVGCKKRGIDQKRNAPQGAQAGVAGMTYCEGGWRCTSKMPSPLACISTEPASRVRITRNGGSIMSRPNSSISEPSAFSTRTRVGLSH